MTSKSYSAIILYVGIDPTLRKFEIDKHREGKYPLRCLSFKGGYMSNKSQIINVKSNSDVSKMAKAMKGWNDTFYTDMPKGVFGSVAIIRCNGAVVNSNDLDLEFSVPFDDDMEANEAEITIYNLSTTTINRFKKNCSITIEAGFKGDTGVIFKGYVSKRKTAYEGADRKTTIKCLDRIKTKKLKEKTYKKGTKASKILKDLLKKTGTPIAVFKIKRDFTYKDEQKVDGDLYENIKTYADVCGISVYVNKGKIYARHLKVGDNLNFTVEESTGMINTPTEYEEEITAEKYKETIKGYEIEMLLQHRMTTGGIIKLKSINAKDGKYRIRSGEHTFNEGEATTKIKVF